MCWFSAQLQTGQWEEIYFFKWNLNIFNLPFEGNFRLVLNGDIGFSLVNKVHFLVMETSSNPSKISISIIYYQCLFAVDIDNWHGTLGSVKEAVKLASEIHKIGRHPGIGHLKPLKLVHTKLCTTLVHTAQTAKSEMTDSSFLLILDLWPIPLIFNVHMYSEMADSPKIWPIPQNRPLENRHF